MVARSVDSHVGRPFSLVDVAVEVNGCDILCDRVRDLREIGNDSAANAIELEMMDLGLINASIRDISGRYKDG